MTIYPIEYKIINVQHAFLISSDGTLQIDALTKLPKVLKFKDEKEARKYVRKIKRVL